MFYGWYIAGIAFLCLFLGAGAGGFAFSVFLPAMSQDLGWSRSTLVGASSLAAITSSLAGPWIGRFVDRRGTRLALSLSVVATGLSCFGAAAVTEPWQFYVALGLLGGISRSALLNVAPSAMISNWFIRRRSLAFSFAALGPPLANLVFPPLAAAVVIGFGWRAGWATVGGLTIALGLIPVVLLARRRPEDFGLLPDGDTPMKTVPATTPDLSSWPGQAQAVPPQQEDWTFREAIHMPNFWALASSMALIGLAPGTVVIFMFSFFQDQGMPDTVAAATIGVMSVVQVISRIAFWAPVIAWLGSVQRALVLWAVLLLFGILFFPLARTPLTAYLAAGFFGVGMGGNLVLQLQIWPEYFGRTAVGGITGAAQLVQGLVGAAGPLLGAVLLDETGSYTVLFLSVAGFVAAGLIVQVIVGKPVRRLRVAANAVR